MTVTYIGHRTTTRTSSSEVALTRAVLTTLHHASQIMGRIQFRLSHARKLASQQLVAIIRNLSATENGMTTGSCLIDDAEMPIGGAPRAPRTAKAEGPEEQTWV